MPGPTAFALDTLATYHAKATFFCIGDNVRKHPDLFTRIRGEGHAIGNHTFNHLNGWKTPVDKYLQNIQDCHTAMGQSPLAGTPGTLPLFRPPYGRITRNQIRALAAYRIIMWDVLSVDYDRSLSAERCLHNTVRVCRPGSIVVFHDSLKAEKNMTYTLPRLLQHFTAEGYTFKSLPA